MLLRDAEAQLGAAAVEALRRDFVAIKEELAHSCGREQDAQDQCADVEERQKQARLAAAAAPPEPDDADSIIADCRWASGPLHVYWTAICMLSGLTHRTDQALCRWLRTQRSDMPRVANSSVGQTDPQIW